MGFVWVDHEHLAGGAVRRSASVPEGLNAFERDADGVSVVPMRREGMTRKERFDALEPSR